MENNFNLRKFLTENKLTSNARLIKEGGYDSTEAIGDLYQAAIEDYLGISDKSYKDNKELYDKSMEIYDAMYDADLMDSTDSAFIDKQVEDFIKANMPELVQNAPLAELRVEDFDEKKKAYRVNFVDRYGGGDWRILNAETEEQAKQVFNNIFKTNPGHVKNIKSIEVYEVPAKKEPENTGDMLAPKVDMSTLEIDGVDPSDYPDFVDTYISAADFKDGTPLTDEELDQLTDEMRDELHQMAFDSLLEGLSEREKELKEEILKTLK